MEKLSREAENILLDRFGKDSIIALATAEDDKPFVRSVNAFYEAGSFFQKYMKRMCGKLFQECYPAVLLGDSVYQHRQLFLED